MKWEAGEARQRFSEVLRAAQVEPQPVYERDRLVAAVVDAKTFQEFESWRRTVKGADLAEATSELRRLVAEEGELEVPARRDRPNAFLDVIGEEAPL